MNRKSKTQRRAMQILDLISTMGMTERQLSKRLGISCFQVETGLNWIESNVCLLSEDEAGKIHLYREG